MRNFHVRSPQRRVGSIPSLSTWEMLLDGVGEFLNVLAGNAMALAEQNGIITELEPPQTEVDFESGFLFELAVNVGNAALFLKPL